MVEQRPPPAEHGLDGADDLVHGHPLAAQLEGPGGGVRAARGLDDAAGHVLHRDRVDGRPAVADDRHHGQTAAEEDEPVHAPVPRAVDPRGTQEDVLQAGIRDGRLGHVLGPEPRLRPSLSVMSRISRGRRLLFDRLHHLRPAHV